MKDSIMVCRKLVVWWLVVFSFLFLVYQQHIHWFSALHLLKTHHNGFSCYCESRIVLLFLLLLLHLGSNSVKQSRAAELSVGPLRLWGASKLPLVFWRIVSTDEWFLFFFLIWAKQRRSNWINCVSDAGLWPCLISFITAAATAAMQIYADRNRRCSLNSLGEYDWPITPSFA